MIIEVHWRRRTLKYTIYVTIENLLHIAFYWFYTKLHVSLVHIYENHSVQPSVRLIQETISIFDWILIIYITVTYTFIVSQCSFCVKILCNEIFINCKCKNKSSAGFYFKRRCSCKRPISVHVIKYQFLMF